ncbi:MAG TPA: hypothetical protein V6D17_03895 [Candidatus Obscuribacterales bacterium]
MSKRTITAIFNQRRATRRERGNTLVLVLALLLGLVLVILFFGLGYTRMLGSHQEQKTAIEAAALAAAKALSRAVVDDPNFGFIGISDAAPKGKGTAAGDKYGLTVRSLNSILATIRLDMIIADQINAPQIKQFARRDYDLAMDAVDRFNNVLKDAADQAGMLKDIDGNLIDLYAEAVNAYQDNQIRMQGGQSTLVQGSMKLSLGCVEGAPTNIPCPLPAEFANVSSSQQRNGFYAAYTNIPYGDLDFVFSAAADSIGLVDHKKFKSNATDLPYALLTVVKAEADQRFDGKNQYGKLTSHTVHAAACAHPSCTRDPKPAPGALAVSFPDGMLPELTKFSQLLSDPGMSTVTMTLHTPAIDDYPAPNSRLLPMPPQAVLGSAPSIALACNRAYYDWLRACGPQVSVQAAIDMAKGGLSPTASRTMGFMTVYRLSQDGGIEQKSYLMENVYVPNSHQQLVGITTTKPDLQSPSTGYTYNVIVSDQVYNLGKQKGGKHGGEPITDQRLTTNTLITAQTQELPPIPPGNLINPPKPQYGWEGKAGGWGYGIWKMLGAPGPFGRHNKPEALSFMPSAANLGDLRPTYQSNGIAADISFHKIVKALPDDN